jgi:hypothetical protein
LIYLISLDARKINLITTSTESDILNPNKIKNEKYFYIVNNKNNNNNSIQLFIIYVASQQLRPINNNNTILLCTVMKFIVKCLFSEDTS